MNDGCVVTVSPQIESQTLNLASISLEEMRLRYWWNVESPDLGKYVHA